jgi:membrane associated rhomboid family serine protease
MAHPFPVFSGLIFISFCFCNALHRYILKRACGGQAASQMQTADHDVDQRNLILQDREVTLEWFSDPTKRIIAGNFTVVWENHNRLAAANFEAVVDIATYYDFSSHLGSLLSHLISALQPCFTAIANAYAIIRPASCRSSAKSSWNKSLVSECSSFLASIDNSLLVICDALSAGHVALVIIVLLNLLCFMPSLADQRWWALDSSRPRLRTLFTYQFAHANLQHIAGNMLTLLFVGAEVSDSLNCDHFIFLALYLLCGLVGGMFAVWFSPAHALTVGASGSVSGVIVALSVLRPNSAVTILGDVNASHPLMLLTGTLLADLKRLNVSWQVLQPLSHAFSVARTV